MHGATRLVIAGLWSGICFLASCSGLKRDVPYVPTPEPLVEQMLTMAQVKPGDVVYDLGCGDGRIVITAAKQYGARGVGIEIDPKLIEQCQKNAAAAGVSDRVSFLNQDLFTMDFKEATVLTLYLLPKLNLRLRPQILDLKAGTRVVSHAWDMGDWEPDQIAGHDVDRMGNRVYFWVVPAKVEGTWNGTIKDGDRERPMRLALAQRHQRVRGTALVEARQADLRGVSLRGDQLAFVLPPGATGHDGTTFTLKLVEGQLIGAATEGATGKQMECRFTRVEQGG